MMKTTRELLNRLQESGTLVTDDLVTLLKARGRACDLIYRTADQLRNERMGQDVHLRGIIEFSNVCTNDCWYCGIRCSNIRVARYRMSEDEIVETTLDARRWGCGTVVMQSGEDPYFTAERLTNLLRRIKSESELAITLSIGVRPYEELAMFREAGCDRFLLRFETTSNAIFSALHPNEPFERRITCLENLRKLGYQVGSGFMIGLPGSTMEMIASDILFATELKLDMIGCGPFLSHPATPLAEKPLLNDKSIYYKTISLLRLLNPQAHIPATTAFDVLDPDGRNLILQRGANVFMPNITPAKYRRDYQLYPNKPCVDEDGAACALCVRGRLAKLGRPIATGPGHTTL